MNTKTTILTIMLAFIGLSSSFAQVGIGTQTPAPSSILDLTATNKGFLPPRLSDAQRDAIGSPAEGLTIFNSTVNCVQFYNGNFWINLCNGLIVNGPCAGEPTSFTFAAKEYKPVVSSGKCWLDRNLGANQVATSSADTAAYGDLYQWGRAADGHQLRTSSNTAVNATVNTDTPPHGDFIPTNTSPFDWRVPQNNTLWQGVNGINNPCPSGYRLPTESELDAERTSWSSNNAVGAFASPLKLTRTGLRSPNSNLEATSVSGYYWSNATSGLVARLLVFGGGAVVQNAARAQANAVRCVRD